MTMEEPIHGHMVYYPWNREPDLYDVLHGTLVGSATSGNDPAVWQINFPWLTDVE